MFITEILSIIEEIKYELNLELSNKDLLKSFYKNDGSVVTQFDYYISDLFKEKFKDSPFNFYSEEDLGNFSFPILILDPIDGTKEFALGIPECAISFGIYYSPDFSDKRNFSWIYNFMTGEEVSSQTKISNHKIRNSIGFVSRTEYELDLYKNHKDVQPVGSIAYKLLLLAKGECRFVVSRRPKNIWDIAAGTHILLSNGFKCLENYNEMSFIKKEKYLPTLIWCLDSDSKTIVDKFHN